MCGIAGIADFNSDPASLRQIDKMVPFLAERGPDDEGMWCDYNIALAHRRLSILDLTPYGHQPMHDNDKRAIITFNGEIYNFKEIRKELQDLGFVFKSTSDTEVLLNGYLAWGTDTILKKTNGVFAFALYDFYQKKLILGRDRFGEKPLYYRFSEKRILFSSDIRSIWAIEPDLTIDRESLSYYLSELSVPQPKTIWNEIKQIKPAHYLQIDISKKTIVEKRYWELLCEKKIDFSLDEILEQLESRLIKSIISRTVSDVPYGCFLSGGIDSGLIVALLAQNSNQRVKTFTVGLPFQGDENEAPAAKHLAERYNTDHTEIIAEPDIINSLPQLLEYVGEPFADSSLLPTFFVSREIAKTVKVALSGDGGDEAFGGYHDYSWAYLSEQHIKNNPNYILRRTIINNYNKALYKLKLTSINYGHYEDYYKCAGSLKLHRYMGFLPGNLEIFSKEFVGEHCSFTMNYLDQQWLIHKHFSDMETYYHAALDTRLLNDYLVKVDRASMKNSLEVRTPFLDHSLIEFAASIPVDTFMQQGIQKFLLKKLASKHVNPEIFSKKKQGFGIPVGLWLKNDLKAFAGDILFTGRLESRKIFNFAVINKLWNEHQSGKADHKDRLWSLICLELWFEKFLDK